MENVMVVILPLNYKINASPKLSNCGYDKIEYYKPQVVKQFVKRGNVILRNMDLIFHLYYR